MPAIIAGAVLLGGIMGWFAKSADVVDAAQNKRQIKAAETMFAKPYTLELSFPDGVEQPGPTVSKLQEIREAEIRK